MYKDQPPTERSTEIDDKIFWTNEVIRKMNDRRIEMSVAFNHLTTTASQTITNTQQLQLYATKEQNEIELGGIYLGRTVGDAMELWKELNSTLLGIQQDVQAIQNKINKVEE